MRDISTEPSSWFTGLKDSTLQLILTGEGMEHAGIDIHYPGVMIKETVEGNNCLIVYIDLKDAAPGVMPVEISHCGQITTIQYRLNPCMPAEEQPRSLSPADVVYLAMPDRFALETGKERTQYSIESQCRALPSSRFGGTLNGVSRMLPHLEDLGITALWLTPVLENRMPESRNSTSYHGYAITDYYSIEPRFGTMEDYITMVNRAHCHGIKVVMDFVFNHCGAAHPWLAQPPMSDWFNNREWLEQYDIHDGLLPKTNNRYLQTNYRLTTTVDPYASETDRRQTVEGWFVKSMPDLNLRNRHLLTYLTQCTIWWIETARIDAIRMDTFPYADAQAMQQWLKALHRQYPQFKVIGETWVSHSAFSAKWQEGELDSTMDFAMFEAFNYSKYEDSEKEWSGMNRVYNTLCYDYLYRNPSMTLAFLDNHDVNRFLNDLDTVDTKERDRMTAAMKGALALLLTIPRLPQIYYGTEYLMHGTTQRTDGDVRRPYPLGFSLPISPQSRAMHRWLRRVLRWRRTSAAVAEGATKQFIPFGDIYILARIHSSGTVLTVVNGGDSRATFRPQHYTEVIKGSTTGRDITTGRLINLTRNRTLSPRQAMIIVINNDSE